MVTAESVKQTIIGCQSRLETELVRGPAVYAEYGPQAFDLSS